MLQIYVAQALVEKGDSVDLAEAESLARKLIAWCSEKENKDTNNEVFARDVLVRSLVAQRNRGEDVVNEVKALEDSLRNADDKQAVLTARITIGRAYASQRAFSRALSELRAAVAEAKKQSAVLQEMDGNLALAETAKACESSAT